MRRANFDLISHSGEQVPIRCLDWYSESDSPVIITGWDRNGYRESYLLCHPHHLTQIRFDLWMNRLERELVGGGL